jgi:sialate O-acetylesterase
LLFTFDFEQAATKMRIQSIALGCIVGLSAIAPAHAEVKPNSLFADNSVLQRDQAVPVWGTAREGEAITVDFAGQTVSTVAGDGKWRVQLDPMPANSTPQTMTIRGDNTVAIKNVLVGDVWVASGQSNMERQLGPRAGQKPIDNWEAEVVAANYPAIREYYVPEHLAYSPTEDAGGTWRVCSPQTVADFSAVGYFFARDVHRAERVPIGVLFTAWGGTVAEAWTSAEALESMPDFQADLEQVEQVAEDAGSVESRYAEQLEGWYAKNDSAAADWPTASFDAADWRAMQLPGMLETAGLPDHDGVVWFRKEIDLPAQWAGQPAVLHLGAIDDDDTTWINGVRVGATQGYNVPRDYTIPASVLKAGRNVLTIRALDTFGPGGFAGSTADMTLEAANGSSLAPVALAGEWRFRESGTLAKSSPVPRSPRNNPNTVTVLYNAMLGPLQSFPIKGAIWYQGESNAGRARQYRELFPLMISDWRRGWGGHDFPFLFVQIAPYQTMGPEIREAQFLTLAKLPNTAMAVTTDVGDAQDIHPARKGPVGARLALAARALAYGEKLEYSGPLYDSVEFGNGAAVVSFGHVGDGLAAQGGDLKGFTIAGADGKFVPARAEIQGAAVKVWSDQVPAPTAVRYGWSNVPDVNLFNADGLPASPFRTDVEQRRRTVDAS